ncbi:hypothetical protein [Thiolapillus sp.]
MRPPFAGSGDSIDNDRMDAGGRAALDANAGKRNKGRVCDRILLIAMLPTASEKEPAK